MIYLYVKTHTVTGLKYFGKTTHNPHKYTGSGKYWLRHLLKHGYDYVTTKIIAEFDDPVKCKEFALDFSARNNIVESDDWANLIEENGQDGAPAGHPGHKFTEEQRKAISDSTKSRWQDPEFKSRVSQKQKEAWTLERKNEQSSRLTGVKRPDHSEKMKGRLMADDHPWKSGEAKSEAHRTKISESLRGQPKSEEHKMKLRVPKPLVVCRIHDKKLMAMGNFMKWYNLQLRADEVAV